MRPIVTCGVMLGPGWRFAVGPSHRAVSNRPGRPAGPVTIAARERARAPRTEVTNRTPVLARPTGSRTCNTDREQMAGLLIRAVSSTFTSLSADIAQR